MKRESERGFTIIELMIALSVLSVLLITSTIVLIQIGRLYSKGVNAANLQNATRNIVADIGSQLQFSGSKPLGCTLNANGTTCYVNTVNKGTAPSTNETIFSYCIGDTRYSYVLDREIGGDSARPAQITPHALWRDTLTTPATACTPLDLTRNNPSSGEPSSKSGSGFEMLGNHMRLTRFRIQEAPSGGGIYNVEVWTAFGDSDLVTPDPAGPAGHSICSGSTGTQFCATSDITTQLTGRVY